MRRLFLHQSRIYPQLLRCMVPCLLFLLAAPDREYHCVTKKESYRKLAEYHAPVIFQETKSTVLDFITRFDYDGDWNGANNWKNAYLFELPAYVYYAVVESTHHYFITYTFFHARDYTATPMEGYAPKTEHENDMEGCTLLVEKDNTPWGKVILLETLAHDHFYKYANPHYKKADPGQSALDGSIVFLKGVENEQFQETAIYIESEGHGVRAAGKALCEGVAEFPGVVYRYSGQAVVPRHNRDRNVGYDLIDIEESLWPRRMEIGPALTYCCADSYANPDDSTVVFGSSFNGPIGSCSAKPPWGWDQADDGPIRKGDWFRDPLFSFNQQLSIEGLEGTYVHNPYLEVQPQESSTATLCSESRESKTVKEATAATLFGIGKVLLSGGLNKKNVGDSAKQLFLTNTVLLEWTQKADFEKWSWDKTLSSQLLPSFISENSVDLFRVPLSKDFAFQSPVFRAPTRYFSTAVIKYRSASQPADVKLYWMYEGSEGFDESHSLTLTLKKSDTWALQSADLSQSPQWDKSKIVSQLKLDILDRSKERTLRQQVAPPAAKGAANDVDINYIILDRAAFADTFER
jgi:hypothetical protein